MKFIIAYQKANCQLAANILPILESFSSVDALYICSYIIVAQLYKKKKTEKVEVSSMKGITQAKKQINSRMIDCKPLRL